MTFSFNGREAKNLTMEQAIERARRRAIEDGKTVQLKVKTEAGKWVSLGTYENLPQRLWEYHTNPKDIKSPLVPVCISTPETVKDELAGVHKIVAVRNEDLERRVSYRLFFDEKPDPRNREFGGDQQHLNPREDVLGWFDVMKACGYFPFVQNLDFQD